MRKLPVTSTSLKHLASRLRNGSISMEEKVQPDEHIDLVLAAIVFQIPHLEDEFIEMFRSALRMWSLSARHIKHADDSFMLLEKYESSQKLRELMAWKLVHQEKDGRQSLRKMLSKTGDADKLTDEARARLDADVTFATRKWEQGVFVKEQRAREEESKRAALGRRKLLQEKTKRDNLRPKTESKSEK
jgi:hypothetical protein